MTCDKTWGGILSWLLMFTPDEFLHQTNDKSSVASEIRKLTEENHEILPPDEESGARKGFYGSYPRDIYPRDSYPLDIYPPRHLPPNLPPR